MARIAPNDDDERYLHDREVSRIRRRDRDREAADRRLMSTGQAKYWNQVGHALVKRAAKLGGAIRARQGKDRNPKRP